MDARKTKIRGVYTSPRQKKKLIEFVAKHPKLISCKVTQDFNYKDSQKLWQEIASECNSIPGARKTWRQWRKTWHDLRSNAKKRKAEGNTMPQSLVTLPLTNAEQEALGLDIPTTYQETPEFVNLNQDMSLDNFNNEVDSNASLTEPETPPEPKVLTRSQKLSSYKIKNGPKHETKHSEDCFLNCEMIAVNEERKIDIKEDYLNFKKDYLRQKLKLMKEQTEALKTIAKELSEAK